MMRFLLRLIGICSHGHVTFPQTRRGVTTICCLDCARTFLYDFEAMRMGAEIRPEEQPATRELLQEAQAR